MFCCLNLMLLKYGAQHFQTTLHKCFVKIERFIFFMVKIILSDLSYLYQYGFYIGENELGIAAFLNELSEEEIQSMADTYTEGYRIGFEITGKDN